MHYYVFKQRKLRELKVHFHHFCLLFCSTLGLTATEIEKTANAFGSSMREIVFPGVSREVMFHSFDEDKRWTLGGLWNFFFILFFSFLFFAEFGKSPAGCDVIFIPLLKHQSHDRSVPFSSHQKMFITRSLRHPGGELLRPTLGSPKNSSILQELKILLYYPQKPNLRSFVIKRVTFFGDFFSNQKLVIQCFALLFPRLFNFFAQFLHTKNNYFLTKKN